MTDQLLTCRVASSVLTFLQKHRLEKTARALLKEAKALGWALEDEDDGGKPFNLIKLCAAEERRRAQHAETDLTESQVEGSKVKRWRDCDEQQKSKKCRSQCQQETLEAAGTPLNADEAVCAREGLKKKGNKKNASTDKSSKGDKQSEPESLEKTVPANGFSKNNGLKRFQRIDDSQWTASLPAELKDNSFWKKKNDQFAVKAAEQLGRVRGKDFRHEKTKKKKATWKGCGEIPMTVNSIQFASDSE
ncbi:hypothetical protein Esti_003241 [Eimeria stiedai]